MFILADLNPIEFPPHFYDAYSHCQSYGNRYTVNNYRQVTGMNTGGNFAFFIYRHFVEIL